jgi:hypothetical protein
MYDFNNVSNRLMRVNFNEYNSVLAKFLTFLDGTELIHDYIIDCGEPTIDVESDISAVSGSYGRSCFALGLTDSEEVANVYHILKAIYEKNMNVAYTIGLAYRSGSKKFQDGVNGFNERVVMVLIRHVESYLTKIGFDMGVDDNIKYAITVNNGQVNLASDSATINAVQNNGINIEELQKLIGALKEAAPTDMNDEEEESFNESVETLEHELVQPKPKKSLINTAIKALKAIKDTTEFAAAIFAIVQFVQTVI